MCMGSGHILSLVTGAMGNLHAAEMLAKIFHLAATASSGHTCQLHVVEDEGNYSLQNYGKEEFPDYKYQQLISFYSRLSPQHSLLITFP